MIARRIHLLSLVMLAVAPALAAQGARAGGDGIVTLGAGAGFTCALSSRGQVFCWGRNDLGQLGRGTSDTLPHPEPLRVALDVAATALAVGYDHACATTGDGTAYCWGDDRLLESGSPSRGEQCVEALRPVACRRRPTRVESALRFRALAAGFRESCGIAQNGSAYCWGDAAAGRQPADSQSLDRCGPPATANWCRRRPTAIRMGPAQRGETSPTAVAFDAVATGPLRTCGIAAGALYCWGHGWNGLSRRPYEGQTLVIDGDVRAVSIAFEHACGLRATGTVLCWGERDLGALGIGDRTGQPYRPTTVRERGFFRAGDATFASTFGDAGPVIGEHRFSAIGAGGLSTCAIEIGTAAAWCWGANQHGQLGIGLVDDASGRAVRGANPTPRRVLGDARFTLIAVGVDHSCGATERGTILCWGLLDGTAHPTPTLVSSWSK
jgi:Alpha-tubulin suppressor and related RCC1 domain-containing proteins